MNENNKDDICKLIQCDKELKHLKKMLHKIHRAVLRKNYNKNIKINFDENLNEEIIKNPNDKYWQDLSKTTDLKPYEIYNKFLNYRFKHQGRRFTRSLDNIIINSVNNHKTWVEIGFSIDKHPFICLKRYIKLRNRNLENWTEEEDKVLLEAVEKYGTSNFQKISTLLINKSNVQCSDRFKKITKVYKKGKWSSSEDSLLRKAYDKYKERGWVYISTFVPGRSDVQCRERWTNSLNPKNRKGRWTQEEDRLLHEAIKINSLKWSKVAEFVKTRTDGQCRRRFYLLNKSKNNTTN
ncbi:Myb-like protein L [Nosema granulosis]|uniref:Myb-like protein L n=1 Tax=Nosema granulosis TaxID=83296 RepID=A0A9P6H1L2_9MICR|nr:Myb-like protein L [Nosema granulosis]